MLDLSQVNPSWTLFLDRDGVINHDKPPYTLHKRDFEFYEGVTEALSIFNRLFRYVIVVTNQRGVGRNMMSEQDLLDIHEVMTGGIVSAGGRIDRIYYCTAVDDDHTHRKPNPGMAKDAIRDFPDIVPSQSIIVGNNISDMKFGRNAGLHTVLLSTTGVTVELPHELVDLQFGSLIDFARALPKKNV